MENATAYQHISRALAENRTVFLKMGSCCSIIKGIKQNNTPHINLLTLANIDNSTTTLPFDLYDVQEADGTLHICPASKPAPPLRVHV